MDISDEAESGQRSLRWRNLLASTVLVITACTVYMVSPYNHASLAQLYGPPEIAFTGFRFLIAAAAAYIVLLGIYYATDPEPSVSKSLRFIRILRSFTTAPLQTIKGPITREDRVAVLSTFLKSFFGPMMTKSLMVFCMGAWTNGQALLEVGFGDVGMLGLFDRFGFWFLMQVILFVDVFFFTVGYLVESRRLGNEIRSVDPTLVGWGAALVCYPPFNQVTALLLGAQRSDFPQFDDPTVHLTLNLLLLALMATYASASAALGLKASNLTHRGIVSRGPYAVIRHPAYTCKNLAWWIGSSPLVMAAFDKSFLSGLLSAGSVLAWTGLYALRALTEEDHLRKVDGDYAAYAAKVKHRFIPGLI